MFFFVGIDNRTFKDIRPAVSNRIAQYRFEHLLLDCRIGIIAQDIQPVLTDNPKPVFTGIFMNKTGTKIGLRFSVS